MLTSTRPAQDRCPGVLRPYVSGDGALVRLRSPGGRVPAETLRALTGYAAANGAPVLQLTSRGNLQLRGLPDPLPADLEPLVVELGLLPTPSHEVMRNIIAAPFDAASAEMATAFDAGLRADEELARLPGRLLVAFDDGTGVMLGEPWDLAHVAETPDSGLLLAAGCPRVRRVARGEAVAAMLELARAFVADREHPHPDPVWNVRDLPAEASVFALLTDAVDELPAATTPPEPGIHGDDLLVGVPLGMLEPAQADLIAELCSGVVVVTPWRSILLPGRGDAEVAGRLAETGLIINAGDASTRVSACVGAPHCVRTSSPTLQIARDLARDGDLGHVHVSGCDRRCGHSARAVDVIAPTDTEHARHLLREATR
ncbi:hypothetical protein [Enemella sp. A6]|uniref:hypothetical protein n=1 Tax=Enemella sp. A6 TaxID=3440152 RepID=UPI003EBF98EE